ncbi:MAG: hypothetical protein WD696_18785 [Bryobacteraceae bacterium]
MKFPAQTPLLALGVALAASAQHPGPMHLPDPTLILGSSSEGTTYLVLPKGLTQITFGAQQKMGDDRRDENGTSFHWPDNRMPKFRYAILNMGFGLGKNLEFNFTLPYTWATDFFPSANGLYSHRGNTQCDTGAQFEGCTGLTDSWASMKWQPFGLRRVPFVLQGDFKFPEIYRHGNPMMGTRTHDFQLSAWTFLHNRKFWLSPKIGHMWTGGAFADSVTYAVDVGWRPSAERRYRNFYLRMKFDGLFAHGAGQPTGPKDRFASRSEIVPGHFFSYNDFEGHRVTWAAGVNVLEWNLELSYARWLKWQNGLGFKEWTLTASRPLERREFIRNNEIVQAPTESEARTREPNSITLGSGEGYVATLFDWKLGQNRHDSEGRPFRAGNGRNHDFRFLTAYMAYGLPKGFEVSALVPYLWGKEFFLDNPNGNFTHVGLNDIWVTVRKQLLYNSVLPLGFSAEFKFPEATRHADRWLGELRHDIWLSLFTVKAGTNWWVAPKFGYKWREGAFSDELPYSVDTGYRPPFSHRLRDVYVKTVFNGNFSLRNDSPRGPKDRFGNISLAAQPDHYFTFNQGAMHRIGFGAGFRIIRNWNVEFINHEYLATRNNNAYQRDWTIGLSRWF